MIKNDDYEKLRKIYSFANISEKDFLTIYKKTIVNKNSYDEFHRLINKYIANHISTEIILNYLNKMNIDLNTTCSRIHIKLNRFFEFLNSINYEITMDDALIIINHPIFVNFLGKMFNKGCIKEDEYNDYIMNNSNLETLCEVYMDINHIETLYSDNNVFNAAKTKCLSFEETKEYAKRVEQGDKEAFDILVNSNTGLVKSIAYRYMNHGMEYDDLIQEGYIGLIQAVKKYDYRKGFRFSTYATWWIRQAIMRLLSNSSRMIRLPIHVVEEVNKVYCTEKKLENELNREPTEEEVASAIGISVEDLKRIKSCEKKVVSSNSKAGDEEDGELELFLPDLNVNVEKEAIENISYNNILTFIKYSGIITDREYEILSLRLGLEDDCTRSLEEVSNIYNVSRERIRQIETKALYKIKLSGYFKENASPYILNKIKNANNITEKKINYTFFDISTIGDDITLDILINLIKLMPLKDQDFYIKYRGISLKSKYIKKLKNTSYSKKILEYGNYIENNLKEMFVYYKFLLNKRDLTEEAVLERVKAKMAILNLNFRFYTYGFKEIYEAFNKLDEDDKFILNLRYGQNLKEFNDFPKNKKDYYNKLLDSALNNLEYNLNNCLEKEDISKTLKK
jgi:RNA polymerase sigma factor (sigma-70 family)